MTEITEVGGVMDTNTVNTNAVHLAGESTSFEDGVEVIEVRLKTSSRDVYLAAGEAWVRDYSIRGASGEVERIVRVDVAPHFTKIKKEEIGEISEEMRFTKRQIVHLQVEDPLTEPNKCNLGYEILELTPFGLGESAIEDDEGDAQTNGGQAHGKSQLGAGIDEPTSRVATMSRWTTQALAEEHLSDKFTVVQRPDGKSESGGGSGDGPIAE